MRSPCIGILTLGLFLSMAASAGAGQRVKEVADMLPAEPTGLGRPIADRPAWKVLAELDSFKKVVGSAERLSREPIPDQPDDLFLDFSRTGNRTRWQNVASKRRGRVRTFVLAECLENLGRFIQPLEETIEELCRETTWVMPAHDRSLNNFHGTAVDIDLGSSALAWELATADYLLGDQLSAETRALIRENVKRRILDPFLAMVAGERERNWWMDTTNNWNSVCLAGVVGSALALVESSEGRARFVLAGEQYVKNFLRGFGADGYCSEGLGYWNYGFGHYVLLAETLLQATGGQIDLLAGDDARRPALFGARVEIMNRVYPAFADCKVDQKPDTQLMTYLDRRYGLGQERFADAAPSAGGPLFACMAYAFPRPFADLPPEADPFDRPLRTWFEDSGILICRPAAEGRIGVALKGGHNAEHHNHNDVGSYVVVLGKSPVLADPGAEVYTARTFSGKRYDSKVLNSWGHPVPVIGGNLQRTGKPARGDVVKTAFSDTVDMLVLDLRSAYPGDHLRKLTRTFAYDRSGSGSLTVTDEVAFDEPGTYGTALITLGKWEQRGPNTLAVTDGDETALVDIDTGGLAFDVRAEKIEEEVRTKSLPTRIAIDLKEPVAGATVTLTVVPDE